MGGLTRRGCFGRRALRFKRGSLPRGLLRILAHQDASNIRPVWLTGEFHLLCVITRCHLRCVLRSKAAIALQDGVGGAADFVEEAQGVWVLSAWAIRKSKAGTRGGRPQ